MNSNEIGNNNNHNITQIVWDKGTITFDITVYFDNFASIYYIFYKLKMMELLIIDQNEMITNNSVVNYEVSSNRAFIIFKILLIFLIFENTDYIRAYYQIKQWNQINTEMRWSLLYQRYLSDIMNYILSASSIGNALMNWIVIIILFVQIYFI